MDAVDPRDDESDPETAERRDLLSQQDYGKNRYEEGARSPGQRIDQREVAPLIGPSHEPEIGRVDEAGCDDTEPARGRNWGIPVEIKKNRKIEDQGYQQKPPDENDLPIALFEQIVPARMQKSGCQNNSQGYAVHRAFS